jgi:hypothetical protein
VAPAPEQEPGNQALGRPVEANPHRRNQAIIDPTVTHRHPPSPTVASSPACSRSRIIGIMRYMNKMGERSMFREMAAVGVGVA